VTAPEIATPPAEPMTGEASTDAPISTGEARTPALRIERRELPGLDPLALLSVVPETRPALLWRAPGPVTIGAPGDGGWVGIGRALRVAPGGGGLRDFEEAVGEALGSAVDGAAAGSGPGLGPRPEPGLRVFFTLAFDPASPGRAFAGGWPGYAPVEAWLPEVLVRCRPEGSDALLVGTPERLPDLAAELDTLASRAERVAERDAERQAEGPRGEVANLSIEWAEGDYRAQVVAALDTLCRRSESHPRHDEGCLTKVVLSHTVRVRPDRPLVPAAILRELRREHPGCFLFAVRPAPGAPVFLGASPERLARVEALTGAPSEAPSEVGADGERRVCSGALAGSAPRGATPEEDEALGRRLLESAKDREEHEIVGDMIAEALGPLCRRVDRRPAPVLEKLATVQHMFTPIAGELHPGHGVLDAVAALHPTPAVGGMPRDRALAAIRELEHHARGLYAGVVGWTAPDGTGDSAVAIRSALVRPAPDGGAEVFAGGGIVRTSDPDVEVEETRLKLAAVLGAMERAVCESE
jgi:isochorismate synthase